MNTKQKAEAWLSAYRYFQASADEDVTFGIIKALLKEREVLLSAAIEVRDDLNMRAENGSVAIGVSAWGSLNDAITLCEKEHE